MYCKKCGNQLDDNAVFCSKCGTKIDSLPKKEQATNTFEQTKKPAHARQIKAWSIFLVIFFIVSVIAIIVTIPNVSDKVNNCAVEVKTHNVTYKIDGTAEKVNITYANKDGGTEQEDRYLPCEVNLYDVKNGQFVSVMAQNQGETGSVNCEILVDNKSFKKASSSGAYVIASCDGSIK